jgi:hypothetical protein
MMNPMNPANNFVGLHLVTMTITFETFKQTVFKSLNGLLIDPIKDIVIEYLHDWGIITIPVDRLNRMLKLYPSTFGEEQRVILDFSAGWEVVPFKRTVIDFSPFQFEFTIPDLPYRAFTYNFTIIYDSHPLILEVC